MGRHLTALAAYRQVEVTADVFAKLAYRGTTGGVLIVGRCPQHRLTDLRLSSAPLILVLSGVEKPGNIGAMLRTADAAAIDAVVVCDPLCDLYNPNAVRASLGTVFTQQIAVCTANEARQMFQQKGIKMLCTALRASIPYTTCNMRQPTAIVMGTEHDGLSEEWLDAADQNIIIPMNGMIDSLNVSTAAAIVLFEAKRQRAV
jgi:TrmH family RNA methyltransferase